MILPFLAGVALVAAAYKPGRDSSKLGAPVGRDHIAESISAKPERFCAWLLDLMGYVEGDTVDDLYPGTGVMGRVLAARLTQTRTLGETEE